MNIPFSKVTVGNEEQEAVSRVLASGWLAAGPETAAFEKEFAAYVGVKYAVFTNSCTSALKIAYKYYREKGAESVMYPLNTFCATYSSAEEMGLKAYPKLPEKSDLHRLYIVTSMHYGGIKSDQLCNIEDSAHRIEPNDPLIGKIRCYSFYATKNMTAGSGGMLVTDDESVAEYARLCWKDGLSTTTKDRSDGTPEYEVKIMAGGYDGNDLAAAIGREQLKKLPSFTARRNAVRDLYNAAFGADWQGNHLYPFFVRDEAEAYRMIAWMKSQGVMCGYHYPGTGWNGVSLPIYPLLTDEEVSYVISKCKEYAQGI